MEENRFIKDLAEAQMKHPRIHYEHKDGFEYCHKLHGEIDIIDSEGIYWGTFLLSVYFHRSYPKGFALLVDHSKAFPWTLEWHISENGECCVCSPLEKIQRSQNRITFLDFMDEYVVPFYSNQLYRLKFGSYKNGSYSHYQDGIWESLEEEFNTTDRKRIKMILIQMGKSLGRNGPCFCGSGTKFKKCHLQKQEALKELAKKLGVNSYDF